MKQKKKNRNSQDIEDIKMKQWILELNIKISEKKSEWTQQQNGENRVKDQYTSFFNKATEIIQLEQKEKTVWKQCTEFKVHVG